MMKKRAEMADSDVYTESKESKIVSKVLRIVSKR